MSPIVRFLLRRLISVLLSFLLITALLYAGIMLTPPETRATLYIPKRLASTITEARFNGLVQQAIKSHHLDAPFPLQYLSWLGSLMMGEWGYSPTLQMNVWDALMARTPATMELTLYSFLLFMPIGLLAGSVSAWKRNSMTDYGIRLVAFVATALPPFILSFFLLSVFYVGLGWFAPERLSLSMNLLLQEADFRAYTGLLTVDGLLNGLPQVSVDAALHLAMPVFTLSLFHWATLARITRAVTQDELAKEYILAARARGISFRRIVWRHAFKNALAPALTSSLLSAANLVTGVFVVEIIYNFHGVSDLIVRGLTYIPDAPAALGFSVYSVSLVLMIMLVLDILQAVIDPRHRDEVLHA